MLPRLYRTDQDIRKQQINTLKIFNANVTEVSEGLEYQVSFTAGGNEFTLQVLLGKEFPNEKPYLKIIPQIVHEWVNSEGEVLSAPGLLNFTIHSDLGRVVQAIIREFERNPPPLSSEHCGNNIAIAPKDIDRKSPSFLTNYLNLNNYTVTQNNSKAAKYHQSVAFPALNTLSLEDLQFLNESPERQEEFLEELPQIKEQNQTVDNLLAAVEELAEDNLSKQEQLNELRKGIEFRIAEVTKLAFENEKLHSIYEGISEKYSPRNIQEHLRVASLRADEESEKVAESFLNGEIDIDKFLSSYIKTRKLFQIRKAKEEKLTQQIDRFEKAGF